MKTIFGIFLILFGVVAALYVSIYLCIVGSIVDAVNMIKGDDPATAGAVLWILARWALAGIAGWVVFIACLIPGIKALKS